MTNLLDDDANLPSQISTPIEEQSTKDEERIEASSAPLLSHLEELRNRLFISIFAIIIGFIGCFVFVDYILQFLMQPYREAEIAIKGASHVKDIGLIYTAMMEPFFVKLDVALFGGICLAFPIIAWQLYRFVAPGLYTHEKKAFTPFLIMAPVLFVAGTAMAYYVAMPMVTSFALRQEISSNVGGVNLTYQGKIADYVHMITTLVIGFGLCFQIPVVQLILGKADLVTSEFWFKNGRYAILAIITVAAFITPPDVVSQLLLSLPLLVLYYGGALMVKLIEKKRKEEQPII